MKKIILFGACIFIAVSEFSAQEIVKDSIKNITEIDHVVIVAKFKGGDKRGQVQQTLYIGDEELRNLNAQSTADVLGNTGLIHVQKSQMGGGSITLRGFEASRNLLMIDGIRMNNLIYRAGHLQNIVTTDNNMLDRIEVLFGPGSSMFGSDALGGVVSMYTKNPIYSSSPKLLTKVNYFGRYSGVNSEITNHVDVNVGNRRFASLTSFTYSSFGDLMGGKNQNPFYTGAYGERTYYAIRNEATQTDSVVKNPNRYEQVQSGYTQYDILQKFSYKQNNRIEHLLNFQLSNSSDIFRYDRLTEQGSSPGTLRFAEWYYGPQFRMMTAYNLRVSKPFKVLDYMDLKVNYQSLEESRVSRRFNSVFKDSRVENVGVIGATLQFVKSFTKNYLVFGVDGQYNTLKSTAERRNVLMDTAGNWDTRYPNGKNQFNSLALFWNHRFRLNENVTLVDGFRLGLSSLSSTIADTTFFPLPITDFKQSNPVYSGSIGIVSTPSSDWKFSSNLSTGYRVPNVDDLAKIFESNPSNKQVIVPNTNLKPEQTVTFDLGLIKYFGRDIYWENALYYTNFTNAITLGTATFNGNDSIVYDGVMSKVYSPNNSRNAFVYGYSSTFKAELNSYFILSAGFTYTYGRIKTDSTDVPMDHIPPFLANVSLSYKKEKFSTQFFVNYNGWKRLKDYNPEGEDNLQYATPEGMPAWFTVNMLAAYQFHKLFQLQAGVDNLFDTQYRTFASGINSPGRNVFVRLNFNL